MYIIVYILILMWASVTGYSITMDADHRLDRGPHQQALDYLCECFLDKYGQFPYMAVGNSSIIDNSWQMNLAGWDHSPWLVAGRWKVTIH